MNHFNWIPAAVVLAGSTIAGHAATLIYEPFDYQTPGTGTTRAGADLLDGQPDGGGDGAAIGLGGTWTDSTSVDGANTYIATGSLQFGGYGTTGNHVRSDTNSNNDLHSRPVTATLDGAPELWFSFLAQKLQNNFNAAEGGLVIGNQAVNNSRILDDNASTGLQGFGIAPTTAGDNWTAYGWDGTSEVVAPGILGSFSVPESEARLLVGQVIFDDPAATTPGFDTFNFYEFVLFGGTAGSGIEGSLNIITSLEVDADQSLLDTLSLTRQVNTAYDEIRFGTAQLDVLPNLTVAPEPGTMGLLALGMCVAQMVSKRRRMSDDQP